MADEIAITELLEIDPSRVDAVGSPANGTEWLILKALDNDEVTETEATLQDVLDELDKAADDKPDPCPLCKGSKKIKGGNVTCPKCKGTGIAPKVGQTTKELFEAAKEAGVAPSGAPGSNAGSECDTCNGTGMIDDDPCPDCDGKPFDPSVEEDGFGGSMSVGDPQGREKIDKATVSAKDQNDLPDSDFAYIEPGGKKDADGKTTPRSLRHFPIMDAAHVRNALARASQSPFGDKAMPKIKAAAAKFDIEVGKGLVEKDGMMSGPNPFLDTNASDDTTSTPAPGSPEWEGDDAEIATNAAQAILQAYELMRQFAEREGIEVAAGEGNDIFDTFEAECVMALLSDAMGMTATLAFHEGIAAQKSEGVAEKAGKRLSNKSVTALAEARDKAGDLASHITKLLGNDDPAKSDDDEATTKSQKDILDMTEDELTELVAKTVVAVEVAKAGKPEMDEKASATNAKNANTKAKAKKPKAENTDLEDEASQGDNDSASGTNDADGGASGAAKAEKRVRTPEEIEAKKERKAAAKSLSKAKKLEKKTAKQAEIAQLIIEKTSQADQMVKELQDEVATMKSRLVPSTIVRTPQKEAAAKATERDSLDVEITRLENVAKSTQDKDIRSGSLDRLKELKAKRAAL